MGASYEAVVEREGVRVRVEIEIDGSMSYPDADENGETAGVEAVRIMRKIHERRAPF